MFDLESYSALARRGFSAFIGCIVIIVISPFALFGYIYETLESPPSPHNTKGKDNDAN